MTVLDKRLRYNSLLTILCRTVYLLLVCLLLHVPVGFASNGCSNPNYPCDSCDAGISDSDCSWSRWGAILTRQCTYQVSDSSYFQPQIGIAVESAYCTCFPFVGCHSLSRISHSTTLNAYGECGNITIAGAPVRFCARAAAPCSTCPANQINADGVCTCTNGCCNTPPSYGNMATNRVRVCAYEDPTDPTDTDWNGYMPYPYNTPSSAVSGNGTTSAYQTSTTALEAAAIVALPIFPPLSVVSAISAAILSLLGNTINMWVVGDGSSNSWPIISGYNQYAAVGNYNNYQQFGCIEIPAAPSPPPFCTYKTGSMAPIPAVADRICAYNEISTAANICVQTLGSANPLGFSSTNPWNLSYNSFERPMIRVGFNDFVQFCPQNNCSANNTSCVCYNLGSYSIDDIHCKFNDMLPLCNSGQTNTPCIIQGGYQITSNGPFRILYQDSTLQQPTNWYQSLASTTYSNCMTGNSYGAPCDICTNGSACGSSLILYGINDGNFADLGFCYPTVNSNTGVSVNTNQGGIACPGSATGKASITDMSGSTRSFGASISATDPLTISVSEFLNSGSTTQVVGSFLRPPMPSPIVASCNTATSGTPCIWVNDQSICAPSQVTVPSTSCTSTNIEPQMVIGLGFTNAVLQSGAVGYDNYPTSAGTGPSTCTQELSARNLCSSDSGQIILHGVTFTTLPTDNNYTQADSNGMLDSANYYLNQSTSQCFTNDPCNGDLYITPAGCSGSSCGFSPANMCCYTGGLRFVENQYWSGATQLCINSGYTPPQQVLTKLVNGIPSTNPNQISSTNPTGWILKPYANCDRICYAGRNVPPCPSGQTCCDTCPSDPNHSSCTSNAMLDLSQIVNSTTNDASGATEAIRAQSPFEAGLCVNVPQPSCDLSSPNSGTGNANWPSSSYHSGQTETATSCQSGYASSSAANSAFTSSSVGTMPTRTCFANNGAGIWGFVNNACVPVCPALTSGASGDGYAIWPAWVSSASGSVTVNGTCPNGYSGNPTRPCNSDGSWGNVNNPCKQIACPAFSAPQINLANGYYYAAGVLSCGATAPGQVCGFLANNMQCNVSGNNVSFNFNFYWACQNDGTWSPSSSSSPTFITNTESSGGNGGSCWYTNYSTHP